MTRIEEYFKRTDTPAPNSPVAVLMRKMLAEFPDLDFGSARFQAWEALDGIGGEHRITTAYKRWLKGQSEAILTGPERRSAER